MNGEALALLLYAFASNVAVSVIPHEPAVIAAGGILGVWPTAVLATIGTLIAGWADYAIFGSMLSARAGRAPPRLRRLVAGFARRPFALLVLGSLLPLPYWPWKALALASGYPRRQYLLALFVGRLPRYAALAWLGDLLALPAWASLVLAAGGLLALAFTGSPSTEQK